MKEKNSKLNAQDKQTKQTITIPKRKVRRVYQERLWG